jgi:flagellar protein FlgJ
MVKPVSSSPIDPSALRRPVKGSRRPAAETPEDSNLKAACEDLEALFIHHLLSEMRKTVSKSGLIDGGRSEEIYTSLMDAERAKEMAHSGGLGLSDILLEQLGGPGGPSRDAMRRR